MGNGYVPIRYGTTWQKSVYIPDSIDHTKSFADALGGVVQKS